MKNRLWRFNNHLKDNVNSLKQSLFTKINRPKSKRKRELDWENLMKNQLINLQNRK